MYEKEQEILKALDHDGVPTSELKLCRPFSGHRLLVPNPGPVWGFDILIVEGTTEAVCSIYFCPPEQAVCIGEVLHVDPAVGLRGTPFHAVPGLITTLNSNEAADLILSWLLFS